MWVFEVCWEGDGEVWVISDAEGFCIDMIECIDD